MEELTALDPTFQSKTFTTILNNLLVPTKAKNLLYKTYQGAAHIGIVGREWQITKAGMMHWLPNQVIPIHCITIMYT